MSLFRAMAPGMCLLQAATALPKVRQLSTGRCSFANEPAIPYFWDPRCLESETSLGCNADDINPQCRFCGAGDYEDIYCPASWCEFENPPPLPYYWDSGCLNGQLGCLADGKHDQCRFCGEYPYNGAVACPHDSRAVITPENGCNFDNEPVTPYFWDAECAEGVLGCKADGQHLGCRFCGAGDYAEIECPASLCTFLPNLANPEAPYKYYWEPRCGDSEQHVLGCNADGIHEKCRFCGANEYESVPCPTGALTR